LEGAGETASDSLTWLRENLAVPIDYVVVVSDGESSRQPAPGLAKLLAKLSAGMRLCATSPSGFVQVYQRVQ
jgi:DNA invertase Pin-like site-specific DNA recombinase